MKPARASHPPASQLSMQPQEQHGEKRVVWVRNFRTARAAIRRHVRSKAAQGSSAVTQLSAAGLARQLVRPAYIDGVLKQLEEICARWNIGAYRRSCLTHDQHAARRSWEAGRLDQRAHKGPNVRIASPESRGTQRLMAQEHADDSTHRLPLQSPACPPRTGSGALR